MLSKLIATVALIASTAGVVVPSAALARDREHGGWQARDDHAQGGRGGYGHNQRGGYENYNAAHGNYVDNRHYARQLRERNNGYDHGYDQRYQRDHDGYRDH